MAYGLPFREDEGSILMNAAANRKRECPIKNERVRDMPPLLGNSSRKVWVKSRSTPCFMTIKDPESFDFRLCPYVYLFAGAAMSGTYALKRWWGCRRFGALLLGVALSVAVFSAENAVAGTLVDLTITDSDYDLDITSGINQIVSTPSNNFPLTSIDIRAGAGGAGLVVGSGAWTGKTLGASTVTLTGDGGTVTGGGTLPDSFAGLAVLGVSHGNTLVVNTMEVKDSSLVTVGYAYDGSTNSSGTLYVGGLSLNGEGSEIWVRTGGNVYSSSDILVEKGRLLVSGTGYVSADNVLSVSGADSSVVMNGGRIVTGTHMELNDGASLVASSGQIEGKLYNNGGSIHVQTGGNLNLESLYQYSNTSSGMAASLYVQGVLTADEITLGTPAGGSGTAAIADGGRITVPSMTVQGGFLTVSGELIGGGAGKYTQTAGSTTIMATGEMSGFTTIGVGGGAFAIASGGSLLGNNISITQTAGTVDVLGTVAAGTSFTVSGGSLTLRSSTDNAINLAVSGSANVTVGSKVTARTFSMSDGTMNIGAGGTLDVQAHSSGFGGVWNMNGGRVSLNDNASFSGGRVNLNAANSRIDMNGNSLNIGSAVNASGGNLLVDNVDTLTLNSNYYVGYDDASNTPYMIIATDANKLVVGAGTKVELSVGARREYNNSGGDMLILDTDATLGEGGPFTWSSSAVKYTYQVKEVNGKYGLYVTDVHMMNRDEQRKNLLDAWREHPRAGDYLDNLFDRSFVNAVIDGNALAEGLVEGYDALNAFGKFNADQLANIMTPGGGKADYDALMLYNGSGVTMANEAVVATGRHLLRRVSDRVGIIRRETIVDEIEPPEGCRTDDRAEPVYSPPKAARVWAEGIYHSDTAGFRDGFAGYEYRGKGLMIGADKRSGNFWMGGTLAYVGGDYEDSSALASNSDINTYAAIAFAGAQSESGLYVNGTLGYAYSDNAIRDYRYLNGQNGWNTADFGTHSVLASLEAGRDFWLGDYVILTPSMGISYVGARGKSHDQWFEGSAGGGSQTLVVGTVTGHSLSLPVNLAVSWDVFGDDDTLLTLTGKAGYAYEFHNKGAKGDFRYAGLENLLNPVSAASRKPGKHTLNLGVSGRYLYKNYEFGFGYDYVGRKKYNSHSLSISAGLNF